MIDAIYSPSTFNGYKLVENELLVEVDHYIKKWRTFEEWLWGDWRHFFKFRKLVPVYRPKMEFYRDDKHRLIIAHPEMMKMLHEAMEDYGIVK